MNKCVAKINKVTVKKTFAKSLGDNSKGRGSQVDLFVRGYQDTIKYLNGPGILTSK